MIENRARQNQSVDQCYSKANIQAGAHSAQHAARRGAVKINRIVHSSVHGGNHKCLSIQREADVTDKTFVQYFIDYFAIVDRALRLAQHALPVGHRDIFWPGESWDKSW